MARKSKKVMPAEAADAADAAKTSKVSVAPEEEEKDELWDLVRVVPKSKSCKCRTETCSAQAVATWASNLEPEDKWDLCEECQLEDFGGWPEGIEPDDDDDEEQKSGVKDPQETGDKIDNKEPSSTEPAPQDSSNTSTSPSEDVDTSIDLDKEDANKSDATPSAVEPSQEDDPSTNVSTNESANQDPASDVPPTAEAASSEVSNDPGNDATETAESGNDAMETDETGNDAMETDETGNSDVMDTEAPSEETPEEPEDLEDRSENEDEEMWDLKKVLPLESIPSIKCSLETCSLPACCIWVSDLDPKTNWYSCLDCQHNDFGGWPVTEELPFNSLTPDHMRVIAAKCSRKKNPAMPHFPSEATSPLTKEQSRANFVTPPPNSLANSSQARAEVKGTNAAKITPSVGKPSKAALAMHKNWQDAAEAMGGKDARIVVSKPAAKKLIFDKLFDAFRPMNITQIYKVRLLFWSESMTCQFQSQTLSHNCLLFLLQDLKAIVPSPVLNTCLQDMALDKNDSKNPFADSEDEEEPEKTKGATPTPSDSYAGSLCFKAGRNQASNLYYVDHTKIKGMDRDQREALTSESFATQAEEAALKDTFKQTLDRATQLLSEHTNEEAVTLLETEEKAVTELEVNLEEARKLKVNEKHKQKTKRRIQNMSAHWRKRKRLCMEFLIALEENTDGSVSAKKCLAGDGQITVDSDEAVTSAALKFAKDKRARKVGAGGSKGRKSKGMAAPKVKTSTQPASLADDNFVGVLLNSQGTVSRVYVDEE
jgi:hypothetical protein